MKKTIHIPPASISLNVLLKDRLRQIESNGFEVIGFSTDDQNSREFQTEGFRFLPSRYLTREFSIIRHVQYFIECCIAEIRMSIFSKCAKSLF